MLLQHLFAVIHCLPILVRIKIFISVQQPRPRMPHGDCIMMRLISENCFDRASSDCYRLIYLKKDDVGIIFFSDTSSFFF